MEPENKSKPEKDEVIAGLERILEKMQGNSKQQIIDLINKRKVELGLLKSGLPPAGYKLKSRAKAKPNLTKESKDSLRRIASGMGRIKETEEIIPRDIDVKDEPMKKSKKFIEEVDSYKY